MGMPCSRRFLVHAVGAGGGSGASSLIFERAAGQGIGSPSWTLFVDEDGGVFGRWATWRRFGLVAFVPWCGRKERLRQPDLRRDRATI